MIHNTTSTNQKTITTTMFSVRILLNVIPPLLQLLFCWLCVGTNTKQQSNGVLLITAFHLQPTVGSSSSTCIDSCFHIRTNKFSKNNNNKSSNHNILYVNNNNNNNNNRNIYSPPSTCSSSNRLVQRAAQTLVNVVAISQKKQKNRKNRKLFMLPQHDTDSNNNNNNQRATMTTTTTSNYFGSILVQKVLQQPQRQRQQQQQQQQRRFQNQRLFQNDQNQNKVTIMKSTATPVTVTTKEEIELEQYDTNDDDKNKKLNNNENNNENNDDDEKKVDDDESITTTKTNNYTVVKDDGTIVSTQQDETNNENDIILDSSLSSTSLSSTSLSSYTSSPIPKSDMERLLLEVEQVAEMTAIEMMEEGCEIDVETGGPMDIELCTNESKRIGFRTTMKEYITKSLQKIMIFGKDDDTDTDNDTDTDILLLSEEKEEIPKGELLERGWEERAASSALRRNAEVWKFALQSVFRVLKPRKMRTSKSTTYTEEEIKQAQTDAAIFIRDGLLRLGPSFVKLGQVISTRTDVLPSTYTDVLRTLTDEVPGFSGTRAKEIVSKELGKPCDDIFQAFSPKPLKAASLGQVHTAYYKGKKVAIKVQRAGLRELFDTDLKNLKKLAVLLEKFDPKTDGADRNWVSIYEESERLLYLEIDYLNEAKNTERFAKDFADIDWVKIPKVYKEVTTPRVLVMEFVESIKMTDIQAVTRAGLDRKLLAKRVSDSFLRQIVETSYFHCDPHSGNLCCNKEGQLVFYDFGQMDELKPNVREGLRTFCTALFKGGPTISDTELAINAKELVRGVEQAGVLSKGADRLSVEKLARYFMRTFKDKQLGKSGTNIKETLGADLQTLTDNNSFRFPATFTFVFRAFVSIEGIGKELDPEFDLGKLAQPFIQKFIDEQKGYGSVAEKNIDVFSRATGLNLPDISTAVSQPRKVAYIEETIRAMENGNLKIRVRSLENEKALERMNLRFDTFENILVASVLFNIANLLKTTNVYIRTATIGVASYYLIQSVVATTKVKKFDKTQAKYVNSEFVEATATPLPTTETSEK